MKNFFQSGRADWLWYLLGAGVYAAAARMLVIPNQITPGGFTGFAAILHTLTGIPTGIAVLVLNMPVLWAGFRRYGGGFIVKTAVATAFVSLSLSVAEWLPAVSINQGLAALFGGLAMGFGLSLVLLHGATTGGVDIIAKLLSRRYPHLTVGRIILIFDAVVVTLTAVLYGNLESALYSVVALYVSTRVTDLVLYGADRGKLIMAVTKKPDCICRAVQTEMRRGVTKARVTGSYTGEQYALLLCTVRRHEIGQMYRIISEHDPDVFLMIGDVAEVLGRGFKPFSK